MNLIKGGDLKNAVVIYDEIMPQETMDKLTDKLHQSRIDATVPGYLSGNLIFENEPARHKLLDVIGDLSLIGKPIKGKVIARYPGHKINTEIAKLIRKEIKKQDVHAPVYDETVVRFGYTMAKKLLPALFFSPGITELLQLRQFCQQRSRSTELKPSTGNVNLPADGCSYVCGNGKTIELSCTY